MRCTRCGNESTTGKKFCAACGSPLSTPYADRQHEAELYRLQGELLLAQDVSSTAGAEKCFRRAIDSWRGQSAKMLELRATTGLARLLASQCRRDQARALLANIYDWFTEGFDTIDLKDAKALLDELNG